MGKKNDAPNTIEINSKLATIASFDDTIITKAGFKLVSVYMNGKATLSSMSLPEIVIDGKYHIGISQHIRQRYYIPKITNSFKKCIKVIKEGLPEHVFISIHTITIRKGRDKYAFRVYGQATKTVILKFKNGVEYEDLVVEDMMKELAGLFRSTCRLVSDKCKGPIRCGLAIK